MDLVGGDEEDAAISIAVAYEDFVRYLERAIDYELRDPMITFENVPYITAMQVSRALGIGEFHVCNLRARGKLASEKFGRRSLYNRAHLMAFIHAPLAEGERHLGLANAFVRWMKIEHTASKPAEPPIAWGLSGLPA